MHVQKVIALYIELYVASYTNNNKQAVTFSIYKEIFLIHC